MAVVVLVLDDGAVAVVVEELVRFVAIDDIVNVLGLIKLVSIVRDDYKRSRTRRFRNIVVVHGNAYGERFM